MWKLFFLIVKHQLWNGDSWIIERTMLCSDRWTYNYRSLTDSSRMFRPYRSLKSYCSTFLLYGSKAVSVDRPRLCQVLSTMRVEFLLRRSCQLTIYASIKFFILMSRFSLCFFRVNHWINRPILMLFYYFIQCHKNRKYIRRLTMYRTLLAKTDQNTVHMVRPMV